MAKKNDKQNGSLDNSNYFKDKIQVDHGDFVVGDKAVRGGDRSVVVGGSVTGSIIATGDGNQIGGTSHLHSFFSPVYIAIQESSYPKEIQEDLVAEVKEIEAEVAKGEKVDAPFLARRLRSLKLMAKDIFDVLISGLGGPGAVISTTIKKIAEKVQAEG